MIDRQVTLIGVDGTEHVLACAPEGGPYHLGGKSQLWGGTGHNLYSREVAGIAGKRLERVKARTRLFAVPVVIEGQDLQEVDDRLAQLASVIDPNGDVIIRYARPDGTEREITARLKAGFEGVNAPRAETWIKVPLVFEAFFPFWRDVAQNIQTVTEVWNNALFAKSNPVTIENGGDVEVWPEIIITGESENVMGMNLVTGQLWRVREVIQLGHTVRIVTDPDNRGVYLNDVLDWSILDEFSSFWPLVPRTNLLNLRAVGPASSDIGSFTLRWRELYQTC